MPRWLIILLIVLLVLLLSCVGGLVWLGTAGGPPEGITVTITTQPGTIRVGDSFTIAVEVANALGKQRQLKDVDLYDPLLGGARVVSVQPNYASFDGTLGMSTYTMDVPIAANGKTLVTFTLQAKKEGDYSGDLDVTVDSILRIHSTPYTISIQPRK